MKIQTELNAPKNQRNTFGKYNYRSCEDILEGVKPLLKLHNCSLIVSDQIELIGDRYYVKAIAILTDNEKSGTDKYIGESTAYAREPQNKKGMDEAQITGSTSSYARKYALNGLFAIDDNKDPDAVENKVADLERKEQEKVEAKKKADINSYRAEIGKILVERKSLGTHDKEIKASIKKNLEVEQLKDCNNLEKLKAYYLKQQGKLTEQKQTKEEK